MNIVLMTNTFTPHVGGVARSVEAFAKAYREQGHRVLVVAPEFDGVAELESDVLRVPAIQHFNGSDFSVVLPVPGALSETLEEFEPEVIHSQHPFLLGMTALRVARTYQLPLLFTHHTLYEQYTHYVPGDSPVMKRFVIELASRYANLADRVFSPSESIRDLLVERGVTTPVTVIPTGVDIDNFAAGDGRGFLKRHHIPAGSFVVGHMGRLAPEKNLTFLARAVVGFLERHPEAVFLLVGTGPSKEEIESIFSEAGMSERLFLSGVLEKKELADALNAMSVFTFASKSETQGMVLTEAMAAGLPVVALDAPGVREVVRNRRNGRLLQRESVHSFVRALDWMYSRSGDDFSQLVSGARETAEEFSMAASAAKAVEAYQALRSDWHSRESVDDYGPEQILARIKAEWDIWKAVAHAGDEALSESFSGSDPKLNHDAST